MTKHLGGYAEAARTLTAATGRPWTRQNLHQTWKRRDRNGFPEARPWNINGHVKILFDMDEITKWAATR